MKRTPLSTIVRAAVALAALLAALFLFPAVGKVVAADRMPPLDARQVKLGGEIGRRVEVTVHNNLLKLDVDRDFLKPFQEKKSQGGFIGLGMLLEAAVRLAAYTGDPKVLALKKHLVDETLRSQQPDGYIGMVVPENRLFRLWDLSEMAYVVQGLWADYVCFQEKRSLESARRLADYILARWTANPRGDPTEGTITMEMAAVGLERAFLLLSVAAGEGRYRDFVVDHQRLAQWDLGIVTGRWGRIEGHAYAYLARCLAQLELGGMERGKELLDQTRRAMDFLTQRDGLVITGTCGDHECWHDTQAGTVNLGETCTVAYLIRVLDALLRREGESRWGDLMERAIYNALFAAQSPDGRRTRYYTPFDGPRTYFPTDTYCCPNNYRRIIAELPGMVYYRCGSGVAVNLYTASSAKAELEGGITLSIRQETDYPSSGRVVIHLEPSAPAEFPVQLRIPRWCPKAVLAVDGQPVPPAPQSGTFAIVKRRWNAGDRIELEMPMPWRLVKGRKAQSGRVAVLRGPLVFCLNRSKHKDLAGMDLRLLTLAPESLQGPMPDQTVRPGGLGCKIRAWGPGAWYPMAKPEHELVLTEYADPAGEAIYFHVPNPNAKEFIADELSGGK